MINTLMQKYGFEDSFLKFENAEYYFISKKGEQKLGVKITHHKIGHNITNLVKRYNRVQALLGGMSLLDHRNENNTAFFVIDAEDLIPLFEVARKESLISGNRLIPSLFEMTEVLCHNGEEFNFNYTHYKLLFVNTVTHKLQYCTINDVICHIFTEPEEIFGVNDFLIYRSPEELKGRVATEQSLLYKYSMMLYQIFTDGRIPFSSVDKDVILNEINNGTYIRPNYYNVSMNSSIRNAIQKNLSVDPEKRVKSFEEQLSIIDDINQGFLYHNEFDPREEQFASEDFKSKLVIKIVLDILIVLIVIGGISYVVIRLSDPKTEQKIEYRLKDKVATESLSKDSVTPNTTKVIQQQKKSYVNTKTLDKLIDSDIDTVTHKLKGYGIYIKKINYERKGRNDHHKLLDYIYNKENKSIILTFTQKGFTMPDYENNFYKSVKTDFTRRKLRVGNVSYIWTSQDKTDRILKTYPPAGTFVYENDSVNLVVGKGENVR